MGNCIAGMQTFPTLGFSEPTLTRPGASFMGLSVQVSSPSNSTMSRKITDSERVVVLSSLEDEEDAEMYIPPSSALDSEAHAKCVNNVTACAVEHDNNDLSKRRPLLREARHFTFSEDHLQLSQAGKPLKAHRRQKPPGPQLVEGVEK